MVVQLLETVEAVSAESHDLAGLGYAVELLGKPKQAHLVLYYLVVPMFMISEQPWGTAAAMALAMRVLPSFDEEVAFILNESARYLAKAPKRSDVSSAWVGLRPLVKPHHEEGASTKGLSREHTVSVSQSGLVTVTGGKWTTYRAMAHDVLSQCLTSQLLQVRNAGAPPCATLKGATRPSSSPVSLTAPQGMHLYGDEQALVAALPGADIWLLPGLSEAMVRFAVRCEFARMVEDVLARRSRALFLDAGQSAAAAEQVVTVLLNEGCEKPELSEYLRLAQSYCLKSMP